MAPPCPASRRPEGHPMPSMPNAGATQVPSNLRPGARDSGAMSANRTITLGLAVAAIALTPAAALAKGGDDDHRVSGKCTRGSTAKLKVKADDGRLETEFEVDQNRN